MCDKEHNISKSFYLTDVLVLCLRGSDFIKMKIKIIWRNDLQINPAYLWFIWLIPGQLRTIFFWFHIQKSTFKSKKWPVPILRCSVISYESYVNATKIVTFQFLLGWRAKRQDRRNGLWSSLNQNLWLISLSYSYPF